MCVIVTDNNGSSKNVEFVLPTRGADFKYDQSLESRSAFLQKDYVFSVKIYNGQFLHVTSRCQTGNCNCVYYLDYIENQLKPCRVAAMMAKQLMFSESDLFVLTGICRGFRIIDNDPVKLKYCRENYSSILKGDMYTQMCNTIEKEVRSGQVSPVTETVKCVHSLGAVVRPDGRIRPITDCSRPLLSINDHMIETAEKFEFSKIYDARPLLSHSGYGAVVDISNAYRSVMIFPPHREYVGFSWDFGEGAHLYVDNALCFGLWSAPSIFNSISNFIVRYMEAEGVSSLGYLDDFFVSGTNVDECAKKQNDLISVIQQIGFKINDQKVIAPSQTPKYLGIILDLQSMVFRLPQNKLQKTHQSVREILSKKFISRKKLEQLTGLLAHCSVLVRGGRTFCRRLYGLLKATQGKRRIHLAEVFRLDFQWWDSFLHIFDGQCPIFPQTIPNHHYFTEASNSGFGAWYLQDFIFGFWEENNYSCHHLVDPPYFDELLHSNINVKELWPVVAGIKRWGKMWSNSYVLMHTDNTQVVSMIASGRSRNTKAMCLLRELFWMWAIHKIDLRASYISTSDNILADKLSRLSPDVKKPHFGLPIKFTFDSSGPFEGPDVC